LGAVGEVRKKKCKNCKEWFQPERPFQDGCSIPCAIAIVEAKRDEKRRRETKRRKEGLKSLSEWLKEAQIAFNAYIRARDNDLPCISCGRNHNGQYHAGHYRSVGANPELRFDESNCHKQCAPCNNHLSGNIVEYRIRLVDRIGQAELDRLEGPHEPKNYTIDDAKEIKAKYAKKTMELLKS
jgi:hypothetical protein